MSTINREAAIELILSGRVGDDSLVECPEECNSMLEWAADEVAKMPTADPVKHGRWIEDKYMSDVDSCIYTRYICSSCGAIEYKKYSYCHCGAKMEEIEGE